MLGLILCGVVQPWMSSHLCEDGEGFPLLWALPTNVCTRGTRGTRAHLMTAIMLGCFRIDLHRGEWLWLWMINAPLRARWPDPSGFKITGIRKTTRQHLCMWISLFLKIFLRAFFFPPSLSLGISNICYLRFREFFTQTQTQTHTKTPSPGWIALSRLSGPSVFPPAVVHMCFAFSCIINHSTRQHHSFSVMQYLSHIFSFLQGSCHPIHNSIRCSIHSFLFIYFFVFQAIIWNSCVFPLLDPWWQLSGILSLTYSKAMQGPHKDAILSVYWSVSRLPISCKKNNGVMWMALLSMSSHKLDNCKQVYNY